MSTRPSLLDEKDIAQILNPDPVVYTINGVDINIYPMDDTQLQKVAEELERIISIIYTSEAMMEASFASVQQIIVSLPKVLQVALPEVTTLIAVCLDLPIIVVRQIKLAHKLGLLKAIIEAEDAVLLIKNGTGLSSMFSGLPQPENVQSMGEELAEERILAELAKAENSTEEPTTNSS